jgi:hypothetical protein
MSDFSIGETLVSGFGLVVRRPVAVLMWGVVFLLIMILPLTLFLAPLLGGLPEMLNAATQHREVSDAVGVSIAGGLLLSLLLLLPAALVAQAVVTGAVYRSVLEPDKRGFASLRLGGQELWLILLMIARWFVFGFVGLGIVIGACIVIGAGLLVSAWLPQPWAGVVRAPFFLAGILGAVGVAIWVRLRLSLAGPMTFSERQFRLFESWNVTRGHMKGLLGLGALLLVVRQGLPVLLVLPIYLIFIMLMATSAGFFEATHPGLTGRDVAEADLTALIAVVTPMIVTTLFVVMLAIGALEAVFQAPWAVAYRELAKGKTAEHPPVF